MEARGRACRACPRPRRRGRPLRAQADRRRTALRGHHDVREERTGEA